MQLKYFLREGTVRALDEAMRWYDSREPGLGIDLACEVDRLLSA